MTTNTNGMGQMAGRMMEIIDSVAEAFLSTASVAAEKINMASHLAQVQMRMETFTSVLQLIDAQRQPLLDRRCNAPPAMLAVIDYQISILAAQEQSVLEKCGIPTSVAAKAITLVNEPPIATPKTATHKRERSRFVPVNGTAN